MKMSAKQAKSIASQVQHFPIQRRWKRLKPFFHSPQAESIWRPCMEDYYLQRREDNRLPIEASPRDLARYQFPTTFYHSPPEGHRLRNRAGLEYGPRQSPSCIGLRASVAAMLLPPTRVIAAILPGRILTIGLVGKRRATSPR